uniref:Uncharacterized protein n=1 Tax=Micrurus spixii TaxID=129469 RepID=A0A2D4LMD7_9SAUR
MVSPCSLYGKYRECIWEAAVCQRSVCLLAEVKLKSAASLFTDYVLFNHLSMLATQMKFARYQHLIFHTSICIQEASPLSVVLAEKFEESKSRHLKSSQG